MSAETSQQEDREKKVVRRQLQDIETDLEKLIRRLSGVQALNEASYLRKAVAEVKKAMRSL